MNLCYDEHIGVAVYDNIRKSGGKVEVPHIHFEAPVKPCRCGYHYWGPPTVDGRQWCSFCKEPAPKQASFFTILKHFGRRLKGIVHGSPS